MVCRNRALFLCISLFNSYITLESVCGGDKPRVFQKRKLKHASARLACPVPRGWEMLRPGLRDPGGWRAGAGGRSRATCKQRTKGDQQ